MSSDGNGGTADQGTSGSLAGLIERFAEGTSRRDEAFARRVASALHDQAAHLTLPEVDAMGLEEVMVTFYMDLEMRLVVTGAVGQSGGQGSIRWREGDFARIPVILHHTPRASPYLFATLDFSPRGLKGTLTEALATQQVGDEVLIRCFATVGEEASYRVVAGERELSVSPDALSIETS